MKNLGYLDSCHYTKNTILSEFYRSTLSWSMKSMLWEVALPFADYTIVRSSILDARHTYSYRN